MGAMEGMWVLWRACGCCRGHVGAVEGMWVLWRACGCCGGHVGAVEGMWVLWRICGCCKEYTTLGDMHTFLLKLYQAESSCGLQYH